jgi:ferredoxin, 2Fe-2S
MEKLVPMPNVTYIESTGEKHTIDVPIGENVMRGALYNGIEGIVGECGGGLSCATCHCYVDDAWTANVGGPATQAEEELLESAAAPVRETSRLSCQIVMTPELDGLTVHLPDRQY